MRPQVHTAICQGQIYQSDDKFHNNHHKCSFPIAYELLLLMEGKLAIWKDRWATNAHQQLLGDGAGTPSDQKEPDLHTEAGSGYSRCSTI